MGGRREVHRCWTCLGTPAKPWEVGPKLSFLRRGWVLPTPTPRLPACQPSGTLDALEGAWGGGGGCPYSGAVAGSHPHGAHVCQDGTGPSRWCLSQQQQQKKRDLVEQATVGAMVPPTGAVISHPAPFPCCLCQLFCLLRAPPGAAADPGPQEKPRSFALTRRLSPWPTLCPQAMGAREVTPVKLRECHSDFCLGRGRGALHLPLSPLFFDGTLGQG